AAVAHILRNAHHHVIAQRTVGIERLLLSDALAVAIVESGHLIFSFIIAASERKTGNLFTASCALIASCSASSEGVSPRRRATPCKNVSRSNGSKVLAACCNCLSCWSVRPMGFIGNALRLKRLR